MSDKITAAVSHSSDIVVDQPIPREEIRAVEEGILVTCTASHCDWQGLFPDDQTAYEAVENHWDHEQNGGVYHYGSRTYTIVRLLDQATAQVVDTSRLGLSVEENRLRSVDGSVHEPEFPRTTGDVNEIVGRGDLITRHHRDDAKVYQVNGSRSHGLPTWSVIYVEKDVELASAGTQDYFWINETIAQDGEVYQSFGEEPLATPAFTVVGQSEHQTDFGEFLGGSA